VEFLEIFMYSASAVVCRMGSTTKSACWRLIFSFVTRRRRMICSTANAARWVGAIGFRMAILLAIKTLYEFTAFMWFFDFNFRVKNGCYVKYVNINVKYVKYVFVMSLSAGSRSTKNIGKASLVILWRTFTTCLTVKPIS